MILIIIELERIHIIISPLNVSGNYIISFMINGSGILQNYCDLACELKVWPRTRGEDW